MINSSRANLSLDLLSFFLQNDSLVFSLTFHFSSVHFIGVFCPQERRFVMNLPKFYSASSVSWRAPRGEMVVAN